jgi:predicted transposase/invertase (TIGR01784 family)
MMTDEQKLSSEERWMLLRKDMARVDRLAQMEYAVNEGREAGFEEGREAGFEQGREEGREAIARAALLKGLAPDFIAEITDLELAIVKRIQAELN